MGTGEQLAVKTEGDADHVAVQQSRFLASVRVPQPDGTIHAGRSEQLAVGTEGDAQYRIGMAFECHLVLSSRGVVQLDR